MKKILGLALAFVATASISYGQQIIYRQTPNAQLRELRTMTDQGQLDARLKVLKASNKEQDAVTLHDYLNSQKRTEEAAEVKAAAIKRFPKGLFDFREKMAAAQAERNYLKKEELLLALMASYPGQSYGFLPKALAEYYAMEGNAKKVDYYTAVFFKDVDSHPLNYSGVDKDAIKREQNKMLASTTPDKALSLLQDNLDNLQQKLSSLKGKPDSGDADIAKTETELTTMKVTYFRALLESEPEKGMVGLKKLYEETSEKRIAAEDLESVVTAAYIEAALKNKRYSEALPLMARAIVAGEPASWINDRLKEAFVGSYGSDKGFDKYLIEIEKAYDARLTAYIRTKLINQPAPDFILKDLDGKTVRLSDLKGKTVVLDFWATWCGPCVASFPAMKASVEHFKNNPDVVFLFIHTWERVKNPTEDAREFMATNKYPFRVLMDVQDPTTKSNLAAAGFKLRGIPSKIVIDTDGRVRFITTGGSRDPKTVTDEFAKMIALTQVN